MSQIKSEKGNLSELNLEHNLTALVQSVMTGESYPSVPVSQKNKSATATATSSAQSQVPYVAPVITYYIIQKMNSTYLTLKKNGAIVFEKLHTKDRGCQKWVFYRNKKAEEQYKGLNYKDINEIAPYNQQNMSLCMGETLQSLNLKPSTTKSMCIYWEFEENSETGPYRVYKNQVYTNQKKIKSAKFLGQVGLYDPFMAASTTDAIDLEEMEYLTVQTTPIVAPIFQIKGPIVSYDFDGVLHLSIKADPEFHIKIERATYHPIDFLSSNLIPFKEVIEQLKVDYENGNQVIIVTARPQYSDKYVKEFLAQQDILNKIDDILYISNKTPFLKAIKVIKHYDDSPKQIVPMVKAGVNVIQVDPPLNRQWINV